MKASIVMYFLVPFLPFERMGPVCESLLAAQGGAGKGNDGAEDGSGSARALPLLLVVTTAAHRFVVIWSWGEEKGGKEKVALLWRFQAGTDDWGKVVRL